MNLLAVVGCLAVLCACGDVGAAAPATRPASLPAATRPATRPTFAQPVDLMRGYYGAIRVLDADLLRQCYADDVKYREWVEADVAWLLARERFAQGLKRVYNVEVRDVPTDQEAGAAQVDSTQEGNQVWAGAPIHLSTGGSTWFRMRLVGEHWKAAPWGTALDDATVASAIKARNKATKDLADALPDLLSKKLTAAKATETFNAARAAARG